MTFSIDLDTNRFVKASDLKLGERSISFLEGETYTGQIIVYSGGVAISADSIVLNLNDKNNVQVFRTAEVTDGEFSLEVFGYSLSAELSTKQSLSALLSATVVYQEDTYAINPLPSTIAANPNADAPVIADNVYIQGNYSQVTGDIVSIVGNNTAVNASQVAITGDNSTVNGNWNSIHSQTANVAGNYSTIYGGTNNVTGSTAFITGGSNLVYSYLTNITGNANVTGGNVSIYNGINSITGTASITGGSNNLYGNVSSISGGINILSGSVKASVSFWLDAVYTGFYQQEFFVEDTLIVSGFKIGAISSGRGPIHLSSGASGAALFGPLSGQFYQRDTNNNVFPVISFSFNSGQIYKALGNPSVTITGGNRIGISIFSGLSGIGGMTFGLLGNQSFVS